MSAMLEDVGGSWKRLVKVAPEVIRRNLEKTAVQATAQSAVARMRALAPVGPDAPHMRDFITYEMHGTMALIGVFDPEQAMVALFNEYSPNHQPFMRQTAESESTAFTKRAEAALLAAERELTID